MTLPLTVAQLARPKLRGIDVETVLKLVEENAKKRFEVVWGYDPSPPKPVKRKGQNQNKKKQKADAAEVNDLRKEMELAMLDESTKQADGEAEWKELPLIVVDRDLNVHDTGGNSEGGAESGEWFIRASQGHSLKLEGTAHLTPVEDDEEGRERVGLMVHGTRDDLWDVIRMSAFRVRCAPSSRSRADIDPRGDGTLAHGPTTHPPGACCRESQNHAPTQLSAVHLSRPPQSARGGHRGVHERERCGPITR